jgi:hypothetical protein
LPEVFTSSDVSTYIMKAYSLEQWFCVLLIVSLVHQNLLTDWLTLWSCALLERPQLIQPVNSFSGFYVTQRSISTFTRAAHCPYPTNNLYLFLFFPICAMCQDHLILLDLIILIILGEEYISWSFSLCCFFHPPVIYIYKTSSLLGPNILSTLFPNTLNTWFSLNVRDQVSHPHRTTAKI